MKPANAKLDVLQQIVSLARVCISYCSTEQLHNHNLILRVFLLMANILNTNPFQKNFAWPGVFHTLSGSIASHTFSTSKSSASVREIGHKKPWIFGIFSSGTPVLWVGLILTPRTCLYHATEGGTCRGLKDKESDFSDTWDPSILQLAEKPTG